MSAALTEAAIQAWLIARLKADDFVDSIDNWQDHVTSFADTSHADTLPHFSLDYAIRRRCLESSVEVMERLHSLSILSADRNISLSRGEVLRPDVVCIDKESQSLVLFELKKSGQTGRQALTELLAYEHELKNVLPFLAAFDVQFVLMSTEWNALMDHAAMSAVVWSRKNLLCLEVKHGDPQREFYCSVRPLSSWHLTGSVYLPEDSVACYTLSLYADQIEGQADGETLDRRLLTAVELIARKGDEQGSHGFALLWRDAWDLAAPFAITICGIAPLTLYRAMRLSGLVGEDVSDLNVALDALVSSDMLTSPSGSLLRLCDCAVPLLSAISRPTMEGLSDWRTELPRLTLRAVPIIIDSWGLIGLFIRDLYAHPAVLKHQTEWMRFDVRNWQDPSIGLALVDRFFEPRFFANGLVWCADALNIGILIGLDISLRRAYALSAAAGSPSAGIFLARLIWVQADLKIAFEEVRLLTDAAKNVVAPDSPISLGKKYDLPTNEDWSPAIGWLAEQFFRGSPIHAKYLSIGINASVLLDKAVGSITPAGDAEVIVGRVEKDAGELIRFLAVKVAERLSEGPSPELMQAIEVVAEELKPSRNPEQSVWQALANELGRLTGRQLVDVVSATLPLADALISPSVHEHFQLQPMKVDWDYLRTGIAQMRAEGMKYPAVQLLASGNLVTGDFDANYARLLTSATPANDEVIFADFSSGLGMVVVTTWDNLIAGKHFPVA